MSHRHACCDERLQAIDKEDPQRWLGDAVKSLASKMEAKDWEVNVSWVRGL